MTAPSASGRRAAVLDTRRGELDQELARFVDYGVLVDRRTRRYLAALIRHRLLGDAEPLRPPQVPGSTEDGDLDAAYARYFESAVTELLSDDDLLTLCRRQTALGLQVAKETVRWLRRTVRRVDTTDVHAEERSQLGALAAMPLPRFAATWRQVLAGLALRYEPRELDLPYYEHALAEAISAHPPRALPSQAAQRAELLLHDLLAAWDARLSAKRLRTQLEAIAESRGEFAAKLSKRIEEHRRVQDLLSPFVDYLDRGWDLSRELWDQADLDLMAEYRTLLDDEEAIRKLADLLGRMHDAEIETDEEELSRTIVTRRWIDDPTRRSEIVGVRESDDLPNMLTHEAALLGDPATEDRFLQKLADKRLHTFAFAERRLITDPTVVTEVHTRSRRRSKGPFILCVDTSYSMAGQAETLAKVLAFAIMRIAIEEDREAFLINFSVSIRTLDLRDAARSLDALAAFLRMSFHGGTDVTLALSAAIDRLDTDRYRDADVLVVSDFVMVKIADHVLERVRFHRHEHDTRFHSLTLMDRANPQLLQHFDTAWLADPAAAHLITDLTGQLSDIRAM